MNVKGKKLLILGSTRLIATIVKKAKEMGVYTVVTDNRPLASAPAKQIADAYYNIDFSDTDAILEMIRKEKIDGVLTGFTDSYMPFYLKICQKAGLPCYGDERQIAIATDKAVFKKACTDAGVPVIPGATAISQEEAFAFAAANGYPLMLKPVDNSGSRGVIKCEREEDLSEAFAYAMSFSSIGMVIVEKFLNCDNVAVSYFAADGEIRLSTTDDRWMYHSAESGSSVSSYSEYPSRYTDRYVTEVNDAVIRMLKENGFRNGMVSLQAFVDERSFYFCEMCFRPSGGQHYLLTDDQNGIDQLALLIEFAVIGSCAADWNADAETPYFDEYCAMLRIIGKPDEKIAVLDGFDTIAELPRVLYAHAALSIGATIGKDGTTAQVIGSVLYKFTKQEDAQTVAEEILYHLKIENEKGESVAFVSID